MNKREQEIKEKGNDRLAYSSDLGLSVVKSEKDTDKKDKKDKDE